MLRLKAWKSQGSLNIYKIELYYILLQGNYWECKAMTYGIQNLVKFWTAYFYYGFHSQYTSSSICDKLPQAIQRWDFSTVQTLRLTVEHKTSWDMNKYIRSHNQKWNIKFKYESKFLSFSSKLEHFEPLHIQI